MFQFWDAVTNFSTGLQFHEFSDLDKYIQKLKYILNKYHYILVVCAMVSHSVSTEGWLILADIKFYFRLMKKKRAMNDKDT